MPDVSVMEQWTYLNWWLTGKTVQSETIMSRKWGLAKEYPWRDGYTKKLGQKIKEYLGGHLVESNPITWFNNKMLQGKIVTAGDKIGSLSRKIHSLLDITTSGEIGVYSVPFDTCAQIMGLGLVKSGDTVGLSFGTSLGIGVILDKNEHTDWCCFGPMPFLPIHNTAMLFDGVASCGGAVSYICSQYGLLKNGYPDYSFLEEVLNTTEPGAEGVTILPYFQGGRRTAATNFSTLGAIDGLRIGINENHIVRALFESIAYIIRSIVEDFEKYLSCRSVKLRAGGGPTANAAFMKMLATVINRPIEVCPFADTALLGTAICVMYGLGWEQSLEKAADRIIPKLRIIHPDNEQVKRYEGLYKSYLKRYDKVIATSYKRNSIKQMLTKNLI
jgi:sugar (pentulose or hexulose) kinase